MSDRKRRLQCQSSATYRIPVHAAEISYSCSADQIPGPIAVCALVDFLDANFAAMTAPEAAPTSRSMWSPQQWRALVDRYSAVNGPCSKAAATATNLPRGFRTAGLAATSAGAAAGASRGESTPQAKEWRRQSCAALPAWASLEEGIIGFFRELPKVMRGRTLVFVGDSVTALTYVDLVWSLTYFAKRSRSSHKRTLHSTSGHSNKDGNRHMWSGGSGGSGGIFATNAEGESGGEGVRQGSERRGQEGNNEGGARNNDLASLASNEDDSVMVPEASTSRILGGPLCHTWKFHGFSICLQQAAHYGGLLKLPRERSQNATSIIADPAPTSAEDGSWILSSNQKQKRQQQQQHASYELPDCRALDQTPYLGSFQIADAVACLPYTLPQEVSAAKENYIRASSNLQSSDAKEQSTSEAADTQLGGRTLTSEDVLVVNAGVHHNVPEETLARNVQGLLEWHHHVCRGSDDAYGSEKYQNPNNIGQNQNSCPLLLWRETLPQHFATLSGEFSSALRSKGTCGISQSEAHCAPLSTKAARSMQKFNRVASPLVAASGVPIVRTFAASAPFYDWHRDCAGWSGDLASGPDCTHWPFPSPVILHTILEVFVRIEKIIPVRTGSARDGPSG